MNGEVKKYISPEQVAKTFGELTRLIEREQDLTAQAMKEAAIAIGEINARRDILLEFIKVSSIERINTINTLIDEVKSKSTSGSPDQYSIAMRSLVGFVQNGLLGHIEAMDRQLRAGVYQFSLGKPSGSKNG